MRFILAGIAFLASLVCFGLGAYQIVQAQAADHVSVAGASTSGAPLIVVPTEVLADRTGTQTITVSGEGPIVAVVGRQNDVVGWVGDTAHDVAAIDDATGGLTFQSVAGAEPTAPDPVGSDLWYAEYTGEGTLDVTAAVPPGFAVLIASTGEAPAPGQVSVTWPLDGRAPWSGPLFVAGIVFLLIALGLLLWALLSMRRGVRPRRASRDEGPVSLAPSTATAAATDAASPDGVTSDAASTQTRDAMVAVTGLAPLATHDVMRAAASDAPDVPAPGVDVDARGDEAFAPASAFDADGDAAIAEEHRPWEAPQSGWAAPAEPVSMPDVEPDEPATASHDAGVDAWVPPTGGWAAPAEPTSMPTAADEPAPPTGDFGFGALAAAGRPDADAVPGHPAPIVAGPTIAEPDSAGSPEPAVAEAIAPEPFPEPHAVADERPEPAFGIRLPADAPQTAATDAAATGPAATDTSAEPAATDRDDDDDDDGGIGGRGRDEPPTPPDAPPAADEETKWKRPRGRDRSAAPKRAFRLVPVLLVGALALSGCSPAMWPESLGGPPENPAATPTSTIDQALLDEGAPLPAINDEQLGRILDDVRAVVGEADAANDEAALAARFTGAALQSRTAVYTARKADPALPAPAPFPTGDAVYVVPQATDAWPRTVLAVLETAPAEGQTTPGAPAAVMLVQESARDPYRVASLTQLVANATLPEAAPVAIGAPGIADLEGTLAVPSGQLAADYGSLILEGDASAAAATFAPDDPFLAQVGQAYRDQQLASIDQTASRLEFTNRPAGVEPLGVGTLDGGAIVAVALEEVETFSARTQLATLSITGRAAALAGVSSSPYGFERVYTDQLLFFVPSAANGGQVQFLGYSQTMSSARQLDQSEVTYG